MHSRAVPALAALALLGIVSCDARSATEGGGGGTPTTGAHTIHLTGTIAESIDCGQCHNSQFQVTLPGSLASANGARPSFDGGSLTCSNVYCHSGGPQLLLGGGTLPVPVWNPPSTVSCGACHALPGGSIATSSWHPAVATGVLCSLCHPGYTNTTVNRPVHVNGVVDLTRPTMTTSCAACHGDATRVLPPGTPPIVAAAPPADRNGSSSPAQPGVGAHQRHLLPGLTAISQPVACAECHVVPTDLVHVGPTTTTEATVDWGSLASANGATPRLVPAAPGGVSITCSNVYCHAGGPRLPLGGGTLTSPTWNPPSVVTCGACHALPGGTVDTSAWHPAVATGADCGLCHTGYTRLSTNPLLHVNGRVDVRAPDLVVSCAACHGDPTRVLPPGSPIEQLAAPPVDRTGSSDTRRTGVGAHQSHLLPGPAAIADPVACTECHVVPTNLVHVGPGPTTPASLDWGPLATSNGATASFDPSSVTCTNYCHGQTLAAGGSNTAPVWTRVDGTQASCGSCHASPPPDLAHVVHVGTAAPNFPCSTCHPDGYSRYGIDASAVPHHVNGVKDVNATALPDWNPNAAGANGWTGTSTGCHGGTRYWTPGLPSTGCW
jgi:predicted CxxxxCH...CXXCH cytochrome family protein